MKAVVITLLSNPYSLRCATRCIQSAEQFGIKVETLPACDAAMVEPKRILEMNDIPTHNFYDAWSRADKAMACFFSHYSAWALSEAIKEPLLILEHDAVFKSKIDLDTLKFNAILNIGKPSYGKYWNSGGLEKLGVQPFFSNKSGYLKGAHAYIVKPEAATRMIKLAKTKAGPADLFISKQNFGDLQEYYPWPVEVEETASTIQLEMGAKAKHAYNKDYQIL